MGIVPEPNESEPRAVPAAIKADLAGDGQIAEKPVFGTLILNGSPVPDSAYPVTFHKGDTLAVDTYLDARQEDITAPDGRRFCLTYTPPTVALYRKTPDTRCCEVDFDGEGLLLNVEAVETETRHDGMLVSIRLGEAAKMRLRNWARWEEDEPVNEYTVDGLLGAVRDRYLTGRQILRGKGLESCRLWRVEGETRVPVGLDEICDLWADTKFVTTGDTATQMAVRLADWSELSNVRPGDILQHETGHEFIVLANPGRPVLAFITEIEDPAKWVVVKRHE